VKNLKAPKDVGTIDGTGFSIGVAASQDRPANIRTALKADRTAVGSGTRPDNPSRPTKDQVFEIFKLRDGKALATDLIQAKKETKILVDQKKITVSRINSVQESIVRLGGEIDDRGIRPLNRVWEEEGELLKEEYKNKEEYKELYQNLQKVQSEIDGLKEQCSQLRSQLLASFEEWYAKWEKDELYTEKVVPPHSEADQLAAKDAAKGKGKKEPVRAVKKPLPRGGRR
jgi:tryptophanyl-tRNA synthetase